MKKAIVLLSGGMDSVTCLVYAKKQGYELYALSFDYGQRHKIETELAQKNAEKFGVSEHIVFPLDLRLIGGSALTDNLDVPKNRPARQGSDSIPVTYVPARNLIFLSVAAGLAEVKKAGNIFIGVNAVDYSGYPDCRKDFIDSFSETVKLATKAGREGTPLTIQTPLLNMSKSEIIKLGKSLGIDYRSTVSCYDPHGTFACGACDSCRLRREGFRQAGLTDETEYY